MNDTKKKIVIGAIKTFSKNPSASMEEIAESINLSRRTLHRYFSSKAELIAEITQHATSLCLNKTREAILSSDNPINQLKTMFLSDIEDGYQFRFLYNYPDNFYDHEEDSPEFKEMMEIFRNLLKNLVENNLLNTKYSPDWLESFYFSTIDAAINLIQKDNNNENKIKQMAWMSYLNGISAVRENINE